MGIDSPTTAGCACRLSEQLPAWERAVGLKMNNTGYLPVVVGFELTENYPPRLWLKSEGVEGSDVGCHAPLPHGHKLPRALGKAVTCFTKDILVNHC